MGHSHPLSINTFISYSFFCWGGEVETGSFEPCAGTSFCRPHCSQIHRDPSVPTSWLLALKACATTDHLISYFMLSLKTKLFCHPEACTKHRLPPSLHHNRSPSGSVPLSHRQTANRAWVWFYIRVAYATMKSHILQLQLLHSWATLSLTQKDTGRSSGLALALGHQLIAVLLSNLYLGLQFWFDSANQSILITLNFSRFSPLPSLYFLTSYWPISLI